MRSEAKDEMGSSFEMRDQSWKLVRDGRATFTKASGPTGHLSARVGLQNAGGSRRDQGRKS